MIWIIFNPSKYELFIRHLYHFQLFKIITLEDASLGYQTTLD